MIDNGQSLAFCIPLLPATDLWRPTFNHLISIGSISVITPQALNGPISMFFIKPDGQVIINGCLQVNDNSPVGFQPLFSLFEQLAAHTLVAILRQHIDGNDMTEAPLFDLGDNEANDTALVFRNPGGRMFLLNKGPKFFKRIRHTFRKASPVDLM